MSPTIVIPTSVETPKGLTSEQEQKLNSIPSDINAKLNDKVSKTPTTTPPYSEGEMWYSDVDKAFRYYTEVANLPAIKIGREIYARVFNDTGQGFTTGQVIAIQDYFGGQPNAELSQANSFDKVERTLAPVAHNIADGEFGLALLFGTLTNVNTLNFTAGDKLYLSETIAGGLQNTRPKAPNYPFIIGVCAFSNISAGVIGVRVAPFTSSDTDVNICGMLNGVCTQTPDINFIVDTGVIYADVLNDKFNTQNLPVLFDGKRYMLNTTTGSGVGGAARVALTPGTASVLQKNFIYIDYNSGSPILAASTTRPATNAAELGIVSVFDVATTQTDNDAWMFRRFNNAIDNGIDDGAIQWILRYLRLKGAVYEEGVNVAVAITNGGLDVNLTTTSGVVSQLHTQTFSGTDGTEYYILNHPTDGTKKIADLNEITVDATGTTISNNDIIGIDCVGLQNSNGVADKIGILLPNGVYPPGILQDNVAGAINDSNNYAVTTPPKSSGSDEVAFRLCRLVLRYNTGGVWDNVLTIEQSKDFQDDRGKPIGGTAGGGGGESVITDFPSNLFRVSDDVDSTKKMAFDATGISTGIKPE
jgi:hypothetical protein